MCNGYTPKSLSKNVFLLVVGKLELGSFLLIVFVKVFKTTRR